MAAERAAFLPTWFDEIWNKGRLDAIDELLAEDGTVHGLGEAGGEVTGPAAFRPFVERLRGVFPDIQVKVEGWNNWDMLSLMQQVDAIQPAAQLLP